MTAQLFCQLITYQLALWEQVGRWDWVTASKIASAPQGTHLMFHTATHSLIFMDTMKMGAWKQTSEWGKGRSPDPILEFYDFCLSTISQISRKQPTTPICDILNDQAYFNGVGNYLRAEILCRAGVDPMQPACDVFKATPKSITYSTFSDIVKETTGSAPVDFSVKYDPGLMILFLARQVQLEVIANDMNKYGTEDQQTRFKAWLRVYEKGQVIKQGSRSVWYSPEQRLGERKRDLGKLIDLYPCPVLAFYKSPTLSFSGGSVAVKVPSPQPGAAPQAGPSAPEAAPSGSFHQIKRVEENILPCDKIAELAIPTASKLLMAATSLGRSGKLDFVSQNEVREIILLDHPVAYAAWQVFESNGDIDDLVDTWKRLAKTVKPEETVLGKLSAELAARPSSQQRQQQQAAYQPPENVLPSTGLSALLQTSLVGDGSKRRPFNLVSSTSAASLSSSSSLSESESDDEEDGRPTKKARGKFEKKPKAPKKDAKREFGSKPMLGFGKPSADTASLASSSSGAFSTSPSSKISSLAALLTEKSWQNALSPHMNTPSFKALTTFLSDAYAKYQPPVYPQAKDIFAAFNLCPLDQVKVVILGQDPYHGANQAHGLCFSVQPPTPPPPSLLNIYKELETDIPSFKSPTHGDLTSWATQGVFLLNTVLTVFEAKPNSHVGMGWEPFTDLVINAISQQRKGVVFMLWGKPAHKKEALIDTRKHHILKAPHPSPLSAFHGWFGSRHFSRANLLLKTEGETPIDWQLPANTKALK